MEIVDGWMLGMMCVWWYGRIGKDVCLVVRTHDYASLHTYPRAYPMRPNDSLARACCVPAGASHAWKVVIKVL